MTTPRPFDPTEGLGPGSTIVDASAGTGKTFTIAAMVARLVAIEGVPIDRLLVVTFTVAATAELKGRVRRRLVRSLQALSGRAVELDDHLGELLALDPDQTEVAAGRIRRALSDFDQAQIFTIHGFAQRLLGSLGLRVRLAETLQQGVLDDLLIRQVANDLVVGRFARHKTEIVGPTTVVELGRVVINHPDARVVPDPEDVDGVARSRVELATAVADEARRRMRRVGAMTYDDGLIEVRDALSDPDIGDAVRGLLCRRYDVGMVDESQDTDPIQWQIIGTIFETSRLVVIGDPKQSIYAFRGADIESYLSAIRGASARRTLGTNWRSDQPLISALDVLFEGVTFGDPLIPYSKVEAHHGESRLSGLRAPLDLRLVSSDLPLPRHRNKPFYRVGDVRQAVADDVASEVVRMLHGGHLIAPDGEYLGPGDIAVLCGTNDQIERVRGALADRNVPSVSARSGAVFATDAAEAWRRFLLGLERPDRMDMVRLAASTVLVGLPLDELATLSDDAALELQVRIRRWHEILQRGGIPDLVAVLNRETGLVERTLASTDGDRLLTDLNHVAEEMHAVSRRGRVGSLAAWLETAIEEATDRQQRKGEEPDSRQRRLETDADAVKVQTIHAAKGLEYPVVMVPFAWDPSTFTPDFAVFHDSDHGEADGPRQRLLDVGGRDSPGFTEHVAMEKAEDAAEDMRLLYVALTRARHHLKLWWVENHEVKDLARLTELLTRDGRTPESLAAGSNGTIEVSVMSRLAAVEPYVPPAQDPVPLEVARLERTPDQAWRRVSFSSLSKDQPLTTADERAEDLGRTDEVEPDEEGVVSAPAPQLLLAELPAGARFGTLVHEVMENVAFNDPALEASILGLLDVPMVTGGWEFDPAVLAGGLVAVCTTPLGPSPEDPTLGDLETLGLSRELSFELPVRTDTGPARLADIGRVMDEHLDADDPYRPYVERLLASATPPFRGFMTGAIDLVARMPDGRFTVMDYKSNALRAQGEVAGPADYAPGVLAAEMVSHHYVLQATLYQVGLHRYLQWRLPGYDPEAHLGGAVYLFIRGMIGPETPLVDGERCGVARWQPLPSMVVALSEVLAR